MMPKNLHGSAAVSSPCPDRLERVVPKIDRALSPGGPIPGAYQVQGRARGEVPSWQQHGADSDNEETSSPDDHNPSECNRQRDVVNAEHHDDVFVAELWRPPPDLVIEGVKQVNPWPGRICQIIGIVVGFSLLAVSAGMITSRLRSIDRTSRNQTLVPPQVPKAVSVNINKTIGDALSEGSDSVDIYFTAGSQDIFQTMLNRTDTTFTLFSAAYGAPNIFGSDFSVISKMVLPLWVGHLLDVMRGYVVEGYGLAPEDLYDGLVLTSVSGYPLYIQMDPFRLNNVTMEEVGVDNEFKNGFIYSGLTYPNPFAPWIGKSLFDVLFETNSILNGDLSRFIALVEASPQVKEKIELQKGSTKATTMFVPTNNALATLLDDDQMKLLLSNTTLQQLLLTNHLVDGNFASLCWWITVPGYNASSTELQLETQAGHMLDIHVSTTTGVITINGDTTIIHQEAFGEQGIVHVIDKPLVGDLFL